MGIASEVAPPDVHEQIGQLERFHQTAGYKVASCFAHAPWVPRVLWAYALVLVILIWNNLPTPIRPDTTPNMTFTSETFVATNSPIIPFGHPVIVKQTERHGPEGWAFSEKARVCMFLGVSLNVPNLIRVYDPNTKQVLSRSEWRTLSHIPDSWLGNEQPHVPAVDITYENDKATWRDCGSQNDPLSFPQPSLRASSVTDEGASVPLAKEGERILESVDTVESDVLCDDQPVQQVVRADLPINRHSESHALPLNPAAREVKRRLLNKRAAADFINVKSSDACDGIIHYESGVTNTHGKS